MAAPTSPSTADSSPKPELTKARYYDRIVRFDGVERALHWVNATLVIILIITGAMFRFAAIQSAVGNRVLVRQIHVWSGIALVVPFTVALIGKWRRPLWLDLQRLGRWTRADTQWLVSRGKRGHEGMGKFNAGQKVNAIFVGGALPVMLMTGIVMKWHDPFQDSWRTGATDVHDWGFFLLTIVIIGHIMKAISEPEALGAMVRGSVPAKWAKRHRPLWYAEMRAARDDEPADEAGESGGDEPSA